MPDRVGLVWARYDKPPASKHYLLLFLGEHAGSSYGIMADKISDPEIARIRANIGLIQNMDLQSAVNWAKTSTPIGYRDGFRRFTSEFFIIDKTYKIK